MSGKQFKTIVISAVLFMILIGCKTTEGTEVISESPSVISEPVYNPDAIHEIGSMDPDIDT